MSATAAIAGTDAPIRKYELGRPIIRREQRLAFENIHRGVAQAWTDAMAEFLPNDAPLEFESMDFDAFSAVAIDDHPSAQIVLFAIASTPISGFLMMTGTLAKFLVGCRLGMRAAPEAAAEQPFTRIEHAIAREITRTMLARLGDAYLSSGLGALGSIRECDDLADSFVFAPEESIALLKFRTTVAGEELRLLIGLSGSVTAAMSAHTPQAVTRSESRNAIVNVARQLPIEAEVVLGSWKVPIAELQRLRPGDQIVLPDGEDAWMAARGVRIRRVEVELTANGASVQIRRSVRMR